MERLTTRNIAGVAVYKHPFECERCGETIWRLPDYGNGSPTEKLAAYEDTEEQGLLLRLPCKVGTIVYQMENNTDACYKCNNFESDGYCDDDYCRNKNVHDKNGDLDFYVFNPQFADKPLCKKQFYEIEEYTMKTIDEIFCRRNDFGKTVFLSRAEAKAKLAEMEGAK